MRREMDRRRRILPVTCLCLMATAACRTDPAMIRLMESRRIVADLHVQFTKAADAANRAVMADTDERSTTFARDADQAKQAVQAGVETLAPLLQGLRYDEEARLLQDFAATFTEYRALDRRILDLAVENTNTEAERLSYGAALEAADAFSDALEPLGREGVARDRWRAQAWAATAVARVREIQAIQAPHIASESDAAMGSLEQRMASAEAAARTALQTLTPLVAPAARGALIAASAALDRFARINTEIISLSRRNTDVRSLALTLNDKGKLTAECDERLRALGEALSKRQIGGTR